MTSPDSFFELSDQEREMVELTRRLSQHGRVVVIAIPPGGNEDVIQRFADDTRQIVMSGRSLIAVSIPNDLDQHTLDRASSAAARAVSVIVDGPDA